MDRKKFLKNGIVGIGGIVAIPTLISSCNGNLNDEIIDSNACLPSPSETAGPFPIKTPADLVRENIVGSKTGIPLLINITIQNTNNDCNPLQNVFVDIWQCDAKGNYSEYNGQLDGNFTNEHFLRGRQVTDHNGISSFVSLYPGWYPGRAPHIHVEVLRSDGSSLLITQIAFPENISNTIYTTQEYNGSFDTSNSNDGIFGNDLNRNLADSVTGNTKDGYTLSKIIKVEG